MSIYHLDSENITNDVLVYPHMHHKYKIFSVHTLEEMQKLVNRITLKETKHLTVNVPYKGNVVLHNINSVRHQNLFKHTECVCCKKQLHHFRIESNGQEYHLNGYSQDGIQLTCDHIYPRSKGGLDHIDNVQMLCTICNTNKGSKENENFLTHVKVGHFSLYAEVLRVPKKQINRSLKFLKQLGYTYKLEGTTFYVEKQMYMSTLEAKQRAKAFNKFFARFKAIPRINLTSIELKKTYTH